MRIGKTYIANWVIVVAVLMLAFFGWLFCGSVPTKAQAAPNTATQTAQFVPVVIPNTPTYGVAHNLVPPNLTFSQATAEVQRQIVIFNGLTDPNKIAANTTLIMPDGSVQNVIAGDTLSEIAADYVRRNGTFVYGRTANFPGWTVAFVSPPAAPENNQAAAPPFWPYVVGAIALAIMAFALAAIAARQHQPLVTVNNGNQRQDDQNDNESDIVAAIRENGIATQRALREMRLTVSPDDTPIFIFSPVRERRNGENGERVNGNHQAAPAETEA